MKNKSKRKKIKEGSSPLFYPKEWLYMNCSNLTPRMIAAVFDDSKEEMAQLWEDAQIVEIELTEAGSVDFEYVEPVTGDEVLDAYLKDRKIKSLFYVTIVPKDFVRAKMVMEKIIAKLGGWFCGDTEDFTPIVGENTSI